MWERSSASSCPAPSSAPSVVSVFLVRSLALATCISLQISGERGQVSLFETLLSGSFLNPGVPKFLVLGSFLIYHVLFLHLLHSQPSSIRCRPILVRSFVLPSTFSCAPCFVRLLFPFWLISACLPRWRVPSNFC